MEVKSISPPKGAGKTARNTEFIDQYTRLVRSNCGMEEHRNELCEWKRQRTWV